VFDIDNTNPNDFGYDIDEGGILTANSISIKDSLAYILDLFHKNLKVVNIYTGTKKIMEVSQYVDEDFFPSECVLFNGFIYIIDLDGTILKLSEQGKLIFQKKIDNFYGDKYILRIGSDEFCVFTVSMWHLKDNIKGNLAIVEHYSVDRNDSIRKKTERSNTFDFDIYYDLRDIKGKSYTLSDSCRFNAIGKKIYLEECSLSSRIDFNDKNIAVLFKKSNKFKLNIYDW